MAIFGAIKAFFSGVSKFFEAINNRQLIDAGKDIERGKQAENAIKDIKNVKEIKNDVDNLDDVALDSELHKHKHKNKK